MAATLRLEEVEKSFTMHLQGGLRIPVVSGVAFEACAGECVALGGPSGIGKSSILKMIYANYRIDSGRILVADGGESVDMAAAEPRRIVEVRRHVVGYVSQFLRVIPRVPALEIVASESQSSGATRIEAEDLARTLLARLNLPARLWSLPPATFSGGEQQRVNIARGFAGRHRLLLLDEPTASLDALNRDVVVALIDERKRSGTALVGIFHDIDVRDRVADRVIDVSTFARAA
ncbi:MAG: phosphonate C-P lyase system protein PhnL [Proteobacteria bacterium]|nr:phosphonate C-P lyase system protein PhnL [Pseudomonadota bacterium]